ncbi:MAG: hypothetical protein ACKVJX_08755 [Verrucomicrobiia bacterium]|jgi:hypothetical protein
MDARTPQPDDGGSGAAADACPAGSSDVSGEYWRWCPRCGGELHNEKCKLRCRKCHYFMSCSDFD